MNLAVLVLLAFLKTSASFARPITQEIRQIADAPVYPYQNVMLPWTQKDPIFIQQETQHPQRTEVLINNVMVAGGMFYRFLRAIYRAGTIVYSYMPPITG